MKPFRLERSDVAAWVHLPREASGRRKLALIVPMVIIGATLGFLDQDTRSLPERVFGDWSFGREAIVVSLAALAWFVVTTIMLTRIARKRIAAWHLPEAETLIRYDAGGVTVEEDGRSRHRRWDTFGKATAAKEHVFLSASEDDVIIIPQRAFETAAEMAEFTEFAAERIAKAEFETSST